MKPELEQYKSEPDTFWQALPMMGVDGYDVIELAERRRWHVLSCWGRDGYDLGNWPLVIIFTRNPKGCFEVIEYVEGDVLLWSCPTLEERTAIIDELHFFHAKHQGAEWVQGYESVEQLPEELKGPYRAA